MISNVVIEEYQIENLEGCERKNMGDEAFNVSQSSSSSSYVVKDVVHKTLVSLDHFFSASMKL